MASKDVFAPPSKEELLFAAPSAEELKGKSIKMKPINNAKSMADIFANPSPREVTDEERKSPSYKASKEKYAMAPVLGALSGSTMGYSDRFTGPEGKRISQEHPLIKGGAALLSGLAPGMVITKGVGAFGKALGLGALAEGGAIQGAVTGAIEGGASDPGEDGSRVNRAAGGMAMGLGLGGASKAASKLGDRYDLYKQIQQPGFSKGIRKEIEAASEQVLDKTVRPNSKKLKEILANSGETVKINPDFLRGFGRPGLKPGTTRGGLDKLADLLERKRVNPNQWMSGAVGTPPPVSPTVEIPAAQAQRLKQTLDRIANFQKPKAFGGEANPGEERAFEVANILRKQLKSVDPRVDELNAVTSDALKARRRMLMASENNAVGSISKDPFTSTDRAQEVLDFDKIADTSLTKRGRAIRDAKELEGGDTTFSQSGVLRNIFKAGQRSAGAAGSKLNKLPVGTKESLILKLLNSAKREKDPEGEE